LPWAGIEFKRAKDLRKKSSNGRKILLPWTLQIRNAG